VLQTLVANFGSLAGSWWFTVKITFGALALACAGGVLIAAAFALSPTLGAALFPWRWCCRSRPSSRSRR
jgi:NitT/TauT family transport system permease protein